MVNWSMQKVLDCLQVYGARDPMPEDNRVLQLQSKCCRDAMLQTPEITDITLQLSKALNNDGDVVDSEVLHCFRELMQDTRGLEKLVAERTAINQSIMASSQT